MHARPLLAASLALLAACGEGLAEGELSAVSSAEAELRTNRDPDRLVVWSNNVENMIYDWKDLVHAMEEAELRPDVFLVQQVTDRAELERLTDFMRRRLGVDYTGVVADAHPDDHRFQGQVIPRPTVTTGIVFRTARFELVSKDTWSPWGKGFRAGNPRCDERSENSGYQTLRAKLWDKVARKHVVAVSLRHWTFHPCSSKNVRELVAGFDGGRNDHAGLGGGADLHLVGGDFNDRIFDGDGSVSCWYRQMNRDLGEARCDRDEDYGFTDPLFAACDGDRACLRQRGGIDMLFARRPDGRRVRTSHFDVVSFDEAHRASVRATGGDGPSNLRDRDGYRDQGRNYSQHRARRAYVHYE